MDFSSDTSAPAHPKVIEAMADAACGMEASYGNDAYTSALKQMICEVFETDVEILPVASGTAANALALSLICGPTEAIACHPMAHINCDERGAPEFFTGGGRLHTIDGEHGRIDPEAFATACGKINRSFVHETPLAALSLTNLTEYGTAYSPVQISELSEIAHKAGLKVHLDGARLANALVSTGTSPAGMSRRAGVDILTLGLTKTGAMGCEIICLFGEMRARFPELLARAKRAGHLPPKMRFVSAQGLALLKDDLWLELAGKANAAAKRLYEGIVKSGQGISDHSIDGNEVFVRLPEAKMRKMIESGLKVYQWPDSSYRFVCNWTTNNDEMQRFTDNLISI